MGRLDCCTALHFISLYQLELFKPSPSLSWSLASSSSFVLSHQNSSGSRTLACAVVPENERVFVLLSLWENFEKIPGMNLLVFIVMFCTIGVARGVPTIYFTANGKLYEVQEGSVQEKEVPVEKTILSLIIGLDYDARQKRLYWSDVRLKRLLSANLDGSFTRKFKELNLKANVIDIAVDDVSRLVFYADTGSDVIAMVTIKEGYLRTVVDQGLDKVLSLAMDKTRGILFYADAGQSEKIVSVNYDGTNSQNLITTDILNPAGLTVDATKGVLYWCDLKLSRVESFDYRGSRGRTLLLHSAGVKFHELDWFNDFLYVTSWEPGTIRKISPSGGQVETFELNANLTHVTDVLVLDASQTALQPAEPVGCGCSHICVPGAGEDWMCLCPDGLSLGSDDRTCTTGPELDSFVLFADGGLQRLFRMDLVSRQYVELPINVSGPIAVAYDVMDKRVYWTDVLLKIIGSARLDGSGFRVVRQLDSDAAPDGLDLDSRARLLFYSDEANDIIASMNLDGSGHQILLSLDKPRAVTLDMVERLVYYTDWGQQPRIGRITYEGRQHSSIVTSGLGWPNGLALDQRGQRLYWCDAKLGKVESSRPDGSDRQTLLQTAGAHFYGIDFYDGFLYISDWKSRSLKRIESDGGRTSDFGPIEFLKICDVHIVVKEETTQSSGETVSFSLTIFGSIVGGLVALIIIVIVIAVILFRRRKRNVTNAGMAHYQYQEEEERYARLRCHDELLPLPGQISLQLPCQDAEDKNYYEDI